MANVVITGVIKEIKDAQIFGTFEKREFWITETEGQYPNTYALEAHQAFCNDLDRHNIGEIVECNVDVRGRYWEKNGKEGVMNTLRCWKIVTKGASQPVQRQQSASSYQKPELLPASYNENVDDLPF